MSYSLNASNAITPRLELFGGEGTQAGASHTKMKSVRDRLASRSSRLGIVRAGAPVSAAPSWSVLAPQAEATIKEKSKPEAGGWLEQLPSMRSLPFFGRQASEESNIGVGQIFPMPVSIPATTTGRSGSSSAEPSTGRKQFQAPPALTLQKTNFESKRREKPSQQDTKTRQVTSDRKQREASKTRPKVGAKHPKSAWKEALQSPFNAKRSVAKRPERREDRSRRQVVDSPTVMSAGEESPQQAQRDRGNRSRPTDLRNAESRRPSDKQQTKRQREDSATSKISTDSRTRLRPPRKPSRGHVRRTSSIASDIDLWDQPPVIAPAFNPAYSFGAMGGQVPAPYGPMMGGMGGMGAVGAMDTMGRGPEGTLTDSIGSSSRRLLDGLLLFFPLAASVVLLSLSCLPQTWWRARLSIGHIQLTNVTMASLQSSGSQAVAKRSSTNGTVASFGVWGWCVVDVSDKSASLCLDATYSYSMDNLVALLAPELGKNNLKSSMFSKGLIRAFLANVVADGLAVCALVGTGTYLWNHTIKGDEHAEAGMVQHALVGAAAVTALAAWIMNLVFVKSTGGKLPTGMSMDGGSITTLTFISTCLLMLATLVSILPNLFAFWKRQHGYAKDQMWGEVELGGLGKDRLIAEGDEEPGRKRKRKKNGSRGRDETDEMDWSPPLDWDIEDRSKARRGGSKRAPPPEEEDSWHSEEDSSTSLSPALAMRRGTSRQKDIVVPNGYRLTRLGGGTAKGRNAAHRVSTWFEDRAPRGKGSLGGRRGQGRTRAAVPPVPPMPMAMMGMGAGMGMMPGMGVGMPMAAPMGMPDGRGGYWMYQGPAGAGGGGMMGGR